MSEKILGGSSDQHGLADKVIAGGEHVDIDVSIEEINTSSDISYYTKQGGIDTLPVNFDDPNGHWLTIRSDNPFEILYLDYEQYQFITPEMVAKNYKILLEFWSAKNLLLNGGAREKIIKRYGEETVSGSQKKLQNAYDQIKSIDGIQMYYRDVNEKRFHKGIKLISEIVDIALADGRLTKHEANTIITKGCENGLKEDEIRNYLLNKIKELGFKPRATKRYPDEFDNQWMTDEEWKNAQQRTTSIFGTTVSTLEEVGELLFYTKEDAIKFIEKYLSIEIAKLSSTDKAMELEKIIDDEKDNDRKYLKVVYHLNPALPFRIDNQVFQNIKLLFDETAKESEFLLKTFTFYEKKYIHIWLVETDPSNAIKLTSELTFNDFLRFVYKINNAHPFYIKNEKYATPNELINTAIADKSLWTKMSEVMQNNQLFIWFKEIGREDWIKSFNDKTEQVINSDFHSENDKKFAAVQTLIQIVEPAIENPSISSNIKGIELLAIEGSHVIQKKIILKLENVGFVKAVASLDQKILGVSVLVEKDFVFHSQAGIKEHQLTLNIESLELVKNKEYSFNIKVNTLFETLTIPVKLRAVFPKKAYTLMLAKYAAIFGAVFGGFRFVLGSIGNHQSWLSEDPLFGGFVPLDISSAYLPQFYPLYALLFISLLFIFIVSARIIRKYEKI